MRRRTEQLLHECSGEKQDEQLLQLFRFLFTENLSSLKAFKVILIFIYSIVLTKVNHFVYQDAPVWAIIHSELPEAVRSESALKQPDMENSFKNFVCSAHIQIAFCHYFLLPYK